MNLLLRRARTLVAGLAVSFLLCAGSHADEHDGTWRLAMRKLPDGTVMVPPTVQGMSSTKNGVNQLVVFWPAPAGTSASLSSISKWEWSESEVAVTPMLLIFDEGAGKPPHYVVGGETRSEPITRQGGRMFYKHPIDPPSVVVEGNKMTATLEGVFEDHWERVK